MIDYEAAKALVNSICYWLSHNEAIGRNGMLHEASIRYPFADALTSLTYKAEQVLLEETHPFYIQRSIDLITVDNPKSRNLSNAFEFKLATHLSKDKSEKIRFFNDLMRLHAMSKHNNVNGYFIVVGKYNFFNSNFRRILTPQEALNTRLKKSLPRGFYTNWFGFAKDKGKRFKVLNETNLTYSEVYNDFYNGQTPYRIQNGAPINPTLPTTISTKCMYITPMSPEFHTPWVGGIWKVT
jgi:hypothetical protein